MRVLVPSAMLALLALTGWATPDDPKAMRGPGWAHQDLDLGNASAAIVAIRSA
jgi:hypothetical protein